MSAVRASRRLAAVVAAVAVPLLALPVVNAATASAASVATWDKVAQCESGGNWSIDTGNGYYGGLQINEHNWQYYGGTSYAAYPDQATKKEQILIAEKILADQGAGAWTCSPGTGLATDHADPYPDDPGMTDLAAGDLTGDGHADLLAVEVATGKLWLYKGHADGTIDGGSTRTEIGPGGWNGMTNLTVGDFNGDGKRDVVGVESSTGKLWLYRGHGDGTIDGGSTRTELGTGWNSMDNLFAGDFTGDGKDDLGGVETSTGKLFLYRGHGDGTIDGGSTRTQLGTGWNSMDKIVGPGDMNGDGKDDLVATETSTGKLFLYRGHGDGTIDGGSTRVEIGSGGWNGISDYAGGDFDGDGVGDLAAVESQPTDTGALYLYKGTGSGGLAARVEIGSSGW